MKLERVRGWLYEGRLEPYKVQIITFFGPGLWCSHLETNEGWGERAYGKNKREVIKKTVRQWLRRRLSTIGSLDKGKLLGQLLDDAKVAIAQPDNLAPLALRDYLEEHGLPHVSDIVRDARVAGATLPGGWRKL